MARAIQVTDTCDRCDHAGLKNVPAVARHTIAIDGPPKKLDFCAQHELALGPYITLYAERGAGEEAEPRRRQKELASPEKAEGESESENKKPGKEKLYVVCTEQHPMSGNGPKRVAYTARGTHGDVVHDGKKLWEIKWDDPDGILTAPCRVHKDCMETGLAFASEKGLGAHIAASPLEKVSERT